MVHHLLGEGGSDDGEIQAKIQEVNRRCQELKAKAHVAGINSQVFNCEIPVHQPNKNLLMAEEQQIEKILKGNGAFSQGQQWCVMGFKSIGSRAIIKAHVLQL